MPYFVKQIGGHILGSGWTVEEAHENVSEGLYKTSVLKPLPLPTEYDRLVSGQVYIANAHEEELVYYEEWRSYG